MEGMRSGQRHGLEALFLERSHRSFYRRSLSCDHGHFRRVFVGCDHVAIDGIDDCFNFSIGRTYAGHEPFILNLNRTHFSSTSCGCTQRSVHVQNTC